MKAQTACSTLLGHDTVQKVATHRKKREAINTSYSQRQRGNATSESDVSIVPTRGGSLSLGRLKRSYARRGYKLSKCNIDKEKHVLWRRKEENGSGHGIGSPDRSYANASQQEGVVTTDPLVAFNFESPRELLNELGGDHDCSPWDALLRPASQGVRISDRTTATTLGRIPRVHFSPEMVVINEIPSHREFTKDEKLHIWNSLRVIKKEACRNRKEWNYEGCWDKNVVMEEDFVINSFGVARHPAHHEAD
jgi:hypothetical protein